MHNIDTFKIHLANIGKLFIANVVLILPFYFILITARLDNVYFNLAIFKLFVQADNIQLEIWKFLATGMPILIAIFTICHFSIKKIYRKYVANSQALEFIEECSQRTNERLWNVATIYLALHIALIVFIATYNFDPILFQNTPDYFEYLNEHEVTVFD